MQMNRTNTQMYKNQLKNLLEPLRSHSWLMSLPLWTRRLVHALAYDLGVFSHTYKPNQHLEPLVKELSQKDMCQDAEEILERIGAEICGEEEFPLEFFEIFEKKLELFGNEWIESALVKLTDQNKIPTEKLAEFVLNQLKSSSKIQNLILKLEDAETAHYADLSLNLLLNQFFELEKAQNETELLQITQFSSKLTSLKIFKSNSLKIVEQLLEKMIIFALTQNNSELVSNLLSTINQSKSKPSQKFFKNLLTKFSIENFENSSFAEEISGIMTNNNISTSTSTLNKLLEAYILQNDQDLIENLYKTMLTTKKANSFTICLLLNHHKTSETNSTLKTLEQLLFDHCTLPTSKKNLTKVYISFLDACLALGETKTANEALEKIAALPAPLEIGCYNTLIKGCAKLKQYEAAERYSAQLLTQGLKPNDITFNTLMDLRVRQKNLVQAMKHLGEMRAAGYQPDKFSFSILINGIKISNQNSAIYKRIINHLDTLIQTGALLPDEIFYNSLIDLTAKFNDLEKLQGYIEQMQAKKIKPSGVTFSILLKAFGRRKMITEATELFSSLSARQIPKNDVIYGCYLGACMKSSRMDLAETAFEEMKNAGLKMNSIIYTTMMKGWSFARQYSKSFEYFEMMKTDPDASPNLIAFNCVIDVAVRSKDLSKALNYLEELKKYHTPDLITYSTLIKGYCAEQNFKSAMKLLYSMTSLDIVPDQPLFNQILDSTADWKNYRNGFEIFDLMKKLKVKPNEITYGVMIKIFGYAKKEKEAFEFFQKMKKSGLKPSLIVYTNLIHICFKVKDPKRARTVFDEMVEQKIVPDSMCYDNMVSGFTYAHQFKKALFYMRKSYSEGLGIRMKTLETLLNKLENSKNKYLAEHISKTKECIEIQRKKDSSKGARGRGNRNGKGNFGKDRNQRAPRVRVLERRQAPGATIQKMGRAVY